MRTFATLYAVEAASHAVNRTGIDRLQRLSTVEASLSGKLRRLSDDVRPRRYVAGMTENYRHTLDALGLCVSAGIPAILWGNPGEGKTSMIESAAQNAGWMVETVILRRASRRTWPDSPYCLR